MIPNWIMEGLFWVVGAGVWFVGSCLFALALHILVFRQDEKLDTDRITVPAEVYRIVELREFVDALWFKLYGHPIDDFGLVRIDRALGRATVGEYRIKVMQEIGNPTLRDRDMFLTLAREAAIDAELARTGTLHPKDVLELEKLVQ